MSDIKHREQLDREISPVDKWKHFQDNYGKKAAIGLAQARVRDAPVKLGLGGAAVAYGAYDYLRDTAPFRGQPAPVQKRNK